MMDNKKKNFIRKALTVLLGASIGSFGITGIMRPNGLTYGGVTGLANLLSNYIAVPYSLIYYAFSMIVVLIVWLTLGFKEVKKIIVMSFAYPIMMFVFEMSGIQLLDGGDTFLSVIFLGVAFGIGNGITFQGGFSSGGTDSIAKVLKYKLFPYLGLAQIGFGVDFVIVCVSAAVFGINTALYALITMFIAMKFTDAVMYGMTVKLVELSIITRIPDELSQYVIKDLGRGVTSIDIVGEYTGEHKKQLKILCSPRESFLIKRFLADNAPESFVSVLPVNSVWGVGKGFQDINEIDK